jgi:hypothetical protein
MELQKQFLLLIIISASGEEVTHQDEIKVLKEVSKWFQASKKCHKLLKSGLGDFKTLATSGAREISDTLLMKTQSMLSYPSLVFTNWPMAMQGAFDYPH